MLINQTLICACGDEWSGSLPIKFQTQEFADRELEAWKIKHGDHIYTIRNECDPTSKKEMARSQSQKNKRTSARVAQHTASL